MKRWFSTGFNGLKGPRRYLRKYWSFSVRFMTFWDRFPISLDIIHSFEFPKTLILLGRLFVVCHTLLPKNHRFLAKIIRIRVKRFICLFKCGCSRPLYPPLQLFIQIISGIVILVLDFTLVEQRRRVPLPARAFQWNFIPPAGIFVLTFFKKSLLHAQPRLADSITPNPQDLLLHQVTIEFKITLAALRRKAKFHTSARI